MTPDDPKSESEEPREAEPKPEGLVEELRQEARELREEARELREEIGHVVEEVVEHVPQPVRWTLGKLVRIAVLVLIALVVVAVVSTILYLANHTELVARELTLVVNGVLRQNSNVQIQVSDLKGNPFRDVRLIEPRVRFIGDDGPVLLEARWIEIRNLPFGLMAPDREDIEIVVQSPTIRLVRGEDGAMRFPTWRGKPSQPGKARTVVARLSLRGGTVEIQGASEPVRGLAIEAEASTVPGRVTVRRMTWDHGPWDTQNLEFQAEAEAGDSVRVRVRRLHTKDLDLSGRVAWRAGDSVRVVQAELRRVTWRWLAGVTQNRTLDVPGEGRAEITGSGASEWNGRFHGDVEWNGLDAEGTGDLHWAGGRLSLVPLEVESAAGRLDGDVAWSKAGWEVGGEVERGDPEQWKAIGIVGWPKGNVDGSFRYVVDTRRKPPSATLTATLGPSELAGWRTDDGSVEVRFPPTGADSFWVSAHRRGGTLHLNGAATGSGWSGHFTAKDLPLDEWPEGRESGIRGTLVRGSGNVAAVPGALNVTGRLEGAETDWLGIHAARWRLEHLNGRMLPTADLTADARLEDATFLGVHFDSVGSPVELGEATLAITSLEAQASDTLLTCSGGTQWASGGWTLELASARMRSSMFDWTADGPLSLSGNDGGVTFERFEVRDSSAAVVISGRWAAPGSSYDWQARARMLDLARLGLPADLGLAGTADAVLEVTGRYGDPRWRLAAEVRRPGLRGHRADTLSFALSGEPGQVQVDRSQFGLEAGQIETQAAFRGMHTPWPDTLDAPAVLRWLWTARDCEGATKIARFPITPLHGAFPVTRDWSGSLDAGLRWAGSPRDPRIEGQASLNPLAWRSLRFDDVRLQGRYADGLLEVREARAEREGAVSTVTGRMPLLLELGTRVEVPESPMTWQVDFPNGDLAMLGHVIPQIGAMSGQFDLRAKISGTPRHPDLDGDMRVRNGRMRMAGREEVFEAVSARFRFDESKVVMDSLTARQGRRGRITGGGVAEFAERGLHGYRFDFEFRDVAAVETGVYAALFDGTMRVTDGPTVNGQVLPFVSGQAQIKRAVIHYNFANVSETQMAAQTAQPLYWTYRLQLRADNNVHWQPPEGDIEFSLNLDAEQTPEELILYGEMRAIRGTYWFLSNRFQVERADLTFDHISGVDPLIDAEATTRVASVDSAGSRPEVRVFLSGRAREPSIRFEGDRPGMDQAEILRDLTVGGIVTAGTTVDRVQAIGDPLDNYLTRALNRTLSEETSRVFSGYISELELERERGGLLNPGEGDVVLGVGTQLTPKLSLRYRERIPGTGHVDGVDVGTDLFNRDIEAEYRLSRLIYVTSGVRQRRSGSLTTTSTVGTDFNVNLKARWEY